MKQEKELRNRKEGKSRKWGQQVGQMIRKSMIVVGEERKEHAVTTRKISQCIIQ